jgi:LacI family transcriptional regulator
VVDLVTLKDVARHAKVSLSTASYALNGSPLIREITKQKVVQAADELGYRPNGIAKNLKEKKTNIIGLFLSGFKGPFFNEMMEGIQDVAIENGYELVVCASVDKHRLLVERYVDGAIILNHHMKDELLEMLANEKMPLIVMDRELKHNNIKNVLLPNELGISLAIDYLIDKGHKGIGFVTGRIESYDGESRLKGFRETMGKKQISLKESDIIRADFTEDSGYRRVSEYLDSTSDLPSALVCANDEMALGAIRAIKEHGLKVPEDIAVVGFDDIKLTQYFNPSISTIHVPRKQWGITAAETLIRMLNNDLDFEVEAIPLKLMNRTSG